MMSQRVRRHVFSLIELLVVVGIIVILAAILLPALNSARRRAHMTACTSNLRQLAMGWTMYRGDYDQPSPWLSTLYSDYVGDTDVYRCPGDLNAKSIEPEDWVSRPDGDQFTEAYDRPGSEGLYGNDPNPDVTRVSYFYECSEAECSLYGADLGETWQDYKIDQLDDYDEIQLPVVRCFWHIKNVKDVFFRDKELSEKVSVPVLNIAWAGNVFHSPPTWEEAE